MKKILSTFAAIFVLLSTTLVVSYLQHRFDSSDLKHAVSAVQASRPQGGDGPVLIDLLAQRYGVAPQDISWNPQIDSKIAGLVTVQAQLPGSSEIFTWQVDLVRFQIHPLSSAAQALAAVRAH